MRISARIVIKNDELESRRKALGYTQADFAEIVGINTNSYSRLEQMRDKPTEEVAESIAIELGVEKDILFPKGYERIVDALDVPRKKTMDYTVPLFQGEVKPLLESADAKLTVSKLLECLPEKERKYVEIRYGLKDGVAKTYEEVGRIFGVTRERMRQIEAKAFERMKNNYRVGHKKFGKIKQ